MSATRPPRLRADLSFIEQVYRGERSYVVKDVAAQRYFRFGATEVQVMRAFDGQHTPQETAAVLAEQGLRISADAIERFARQLADAGFLERTMRQRTTLQMERVRAERRQRRGRALFRGEILRMRWSFGDPDALLTRVLPAIRWMFTPAFLALSVVLFSVYFIVLGQRLPEYSSALQAMYAPQALTLGHVAIFVVTGLMVVLIHELGHGFTCKYFGGEVHELGFMLLYFQPAFYCNVSDAWSFPELRARLWVTAAGSWIQLVVAALAAIAWWAAAPGTLVAEMSLTAMLIGGAMTLLTNMNPLLPLDGYFALTDWLEIPNLRQRAVAHFGWWLQHTVFRLDRPEPAASPRERRVFLTYGALAGVYIALTLALFAAFVLGWAGRTFGTVGTVVASGALVLMVRSTLLSWSRALVLAARAHRAAWGRHLRSRSALLVALIVLSSGFFIPRPLRTVGTFVVQPVMSRVITSADSDVVLEVLARQGSRLSAGAAVVRLVDYGLERDLLTATRAVDSLAVAERVAREGGRSGDAEALAANRRASEAQWMALERRATRLTLRAPVAGVVADLRPEDLVGRQVHAGDSLLTVVALDSVEARIALGGAGATQVHPGQVVHLVSYADPGVPRTGRVNDVSAAGVRSSNRIGVVEARVRLAPGDAWRPGIRGEASVDLEGSTLFGVLWWKLKQSVRTDLWL